LEIPAVAGWSFEPGILALCFMGLKHKHNSARINLNATSLVEAFVQAAVFLIQRGLIHLRNFAFQDPSSTIGVQARIKILKEEGYIADVQEEAQETNPKKLTIVLKYGRDRQSAIDERTTRHQGYGMSQSRRAMIECIFGWGKQHGTMRKTKHRGICGVAADLAAVIAEEGFQSLKAPIRRVGIPNVPVPCHQYEEEFITPSTDRLLDAERAVCGRTVN
jgi:hypothetical protein